MAWLLVYAQDLPKRTIINRIICVSLNRQLFSRSSSRWLLLFLDVSSRILETSFKISKILAVMNCCNPFVHNVSFLYPLKTSENRKVIKQFLRKILSPYSDLPLPTPCYFSPTINSVFFLFETVLWTEALSFLMFSFKTWVVDIGMFQVFLFRFEQFLLLRMSFIFIKCNIPFLKKFKYFSKPSFFWRLAISITRGKPVKYYYKIIYKVRNKILLKPNCFLNNRESN